MRIVRPVVRTVGALTETVRDISRLREVATVLVGHGLGLLVANVDIPGFRNPRGRRFESTPARTVAAIQELGPTFIKLGQVLSTRPDVIPAAYVDAFQQLQDDVEPLDFGSLERTLEHELGTGWRDQIQDFDERPLATASIAQVHRATLKSGQTVVFKIQRPGIAAQIRSDLSILNLLITRALAEFPEIASFDPKSILDEFQRSITAELDFLAEATHTRRFAENFDGHPDVRVPLVFHELTTARVLCLEFLDGVKIRHAREAGHDMAQVGERYLQVAYTMLFDHGLFHGDLHPGNVVVLDGGVLGLLDFGMVGRLTRDMRDDIVGLIFAMERGDFRTIARIFFDIAIKDTRVDYDAFERDAMNAMERSWQGVSFKELQLGMFLSDITRGAVRHRVRAPPAFTMFFKALLTTEGLAKALLPEVDPLAAARPWVERLVQERFSGGRIREDAFYNLVTLTTLGRRLPTTLTQLFDDLDNQRLSLSTQMSSSPDERHWEDKRRNQLTLALFAMTAAMCGTATLFWDGVTIFGLPLLPIVFYSAAAPLFILTLLRTLWNR